MAAWLPLAVQHFSAARLPRRRIGHSSRNDERDRSIPPPGGCTAGKSCDTKVEACESVSLLCVEDLSDVLAVDFHFDIMSHVVGGVADAVQADVLCLGAFCIDQLALLGRVVVVVVSPSFSLSYNYTIILRLNRRISSLLFCKSLIIFAQVEM